MIEYPVTMRIAQKAMHHKDERGKPQPLCIPCLASGKEEKATARELHACNNPQHVAQMRRVTRWAKRVALWVTGGRVNAA